MRNLFLIALCFAALAGAQTDQDGSSDHPLVSRYPGSWIHDYSANEFDQYNIVVGMGRSRPEKTESVEGKVTRILYRNPEGRSTLEIFRNFTGALAVPASSSCTPATNGSAASRPAAGASPPASRPLLPPGTIAIGWASG